MLRKPVVLTTAFVVRFVCRITNDAREEEMEQNMGEVSNMLGNLRNMAVDMSNEIGGQTIQIERINVQVCCLINTDLLLYVCMYVCMYLVFI